MQGRQQVGFIVHFSSSSGMCINALIFGSLRTARFSLLRGKLNALFEARNQAFIVYSETRFPLGKVLLALLQVIEQFCPPTHATSQGQSHLTQFLITPKPLVRLRHLVSFLLSSPLMEVSDIIPAYIRAWLQIVEECVYPALTPVAFQTHCWNRKRAFRAFPVSTHRIEAARR